MPTDYDDEHDDRPRPRRPESSAIENVIPFRNALALAAYYSSIFTLIPCVIGLGIVGVIPIVLGILGPRHAANDEMARGRAHAWVGIIIGGLEVLAGCGVIGTFIYLLVAGPQWG
ncbi:MAG: hypothetical protein EXS16_14965 [Gemmataceae bacterium]|nr:hypothetical protein [Gemmataceae bacterium]